MDLKEIWCEDSIRLAQGSVAGCYEFGDEPCGSLEGDLSISFIALLHGVSY
jgi:hypothetical protein